MAWLYDEMILLQQVVAPLVGIQKEAPELLKLLRVENKVVDQLQEWALKYLNVLQQLVRKDRIFIELEIVYLRLHHQNYIHFGEHATKIISTYGQCHNGFEFVA